MNIKIILILILTILKLSASTHNNTANDRDVRLNYFTESAERPFENSVGEKRHLEELEHLKKTTRLDGASIPPVNKEAFALTPNGMYEIAEYFFNENSRDDALVFYEKAGRLGGPDLLRKITKRSLEFNTGPVFHLQKIYYDRVNNPSKINTVMNSRGEYTFAAYKKKEIKKKAEESYKQAEERTDGLFSYPDDTRGEEDVLIAAIPLYKEAGKLNFSDARYKFSRCVFIGKGFEENENDEEYRLAFQWMKELADSEHDSIENALCMKLREACFYTGACFYAGTGIPVNFDESIKYLIKSEEYGLNPLDMPMGFMELQIGDVPYATTFYILRDIVQKYFKMIKNSPSAGEPSLEEPSVGDKAFKCLKAMHNMMLDEYIDNESNESWRVTFPFTLEHLALCYLKGYGTQKNDKMVEKYLHKLAEMCKGEYDY